MNPCPGHGGWGRLMVAKWTCVVAAVLLLLSVAAAAFTALPLLLLGFPDDDVYYNIVAMETLQSVTKFGTAPVQLNCTR